MSLKLVLQMISLSWYTPSCLQAIYFWLQKQQRQRKVWLAINLSMAEMNRKYLQRSRRRAFSQSVVESGMHQLKLNRLYVFSLSSCCLQWNVRMFADTTVGLVKSCLFKGGFDRSFQFLLVKCSDEDEQDEWAFYQIESVLHKLFVKKKRIQVLKEHEPLCQCVTCVI